MPLGRQFDRALAILKWPIAIASLWMIAPLSYATASLAIQIFKHPITLAGFVGGIFLYATLWRPFARRKFKTDWLLTFEHELTHALFALLTGHRVSSFSVTRTGGHVEVMGGSNWLITIAPYFFPTAPLILLLISILMPLGAILPWTGLFLGFSTAYHVRSTWIETDKRQTDLQKVGSLFCWLFLPSANLFALGIIVSFAIGGNEDLMLFLSDISSAVQWILGSITSIDSNLDLPSS